MSRYVWTGPLDHHMKIVHFNFKMKVLLIADDHLRHSHQYFYLVRLNGVVSW